MDVLFSANNYLKYRLRAAGRHDLHSPFVFEFYNNIVRDTTPFYGFDLIESIRSGLLLDQSRIDVMDFGTGNHRQRRISDIARTSVKPKRFGQFLFRMVNRYKPENILELGTSLGITTLYLSLPEKTSRVVTLEGCSETAGIARRNFDRLKRKNIELIAGNIDTTLSEAIQKLGRLDFVFFDGNHRKDATLTYFKKCLEKAGENSIFVFDDIHWSREMNLAWEEIKSNEAVTLTVDLFQMGIVFFRKGFTRQDFILRF